MKRRKLNKEFKKNSIEQLLESACVQLTRQNAKLRVILLTLMRETNKNMKDLDINNWIENAIERCPNLSEEQEMHILRQIDDYKYRGNKPEKK